MKKLVQARAIHKCTECGRDIFPGDMCMSESSRKNYVYLTSYLCKKCTEQLLSKRDSDVPVEAEHTPNSDIAEKYQYPLDANGVPCKIEDHLLSSTYPIQEIIVKFIGNMGKNNRPSVCWVSEHGLSWEYSSMFHHVEPPKQLTKEDIDKMAKMDTSEYWNCNWECIPRDSFNVLCPSKIENECPSIHYEVETCSQAQTLDILRLERERVAGEQA